MAELGGDRGVVALDDGPGWMCLAMVYTALGEAEVEADGGEAVASRGKHNGGCHVRHHLPVYY